MKIAQYPNEILLQMGPKGVFTLPKALRSRANIADGAYVKAILNSGKITLEPVKMVAYPVREYTDEEVDEFLKEDKKLDSKVAAALDKKFGIKLDLK